MFRHDKILNFLKITHNTKCTLDMKIQEYFQVKILQHTFFHTKNKKIGQRIIFERNSKLLSKFFFAHFLDSKIGFQK